MWKVLNLATLVLILMLVCVGIVPLIHCLFWVILGVAQVAWVIGVNLAIIVLCGVVIASVSAAMKGGKM